MATSRIPSPVAVVVGEVLSSHYYNHGQLETLFIEKGAPGDPPEGNCRNKCVNWLKRASVEMDVDALAILGGVLEEFMEVDRVHFGGRPSVQDENRKRVNDILAKYGMTYHLGGNIRGATTAMPSRTLEAMLRARDLGGVDTEFERAMKSVETDPATAITAACSLLESFCKVYIEDEGLSLPSDQSVKPLWKTVQGHLGLDPAQMADDDLKRILAGLTSIVDGIGAFRTHTGSAHGRGRRAYKPAPRHARLSLHAAHSLVTFAIETWDARKSAARAG